MPAPTKFQIKIPTESSRSVESTRITALQAARVLMERDEVPARMVGALSFAERLPDGSVIWTGNAYRAEVSS